VGAAVILTCVLFLPAAADPLNTVKLTALLLSAIAIALWATSRAIVTRRVIYSRSPTVVTAVLLLLAFVISALTAPVATTAVVGAYGRNSGLLAFSAALILYLTVVLAVPRASINSIFWAVVGAAVFTAAYGQLQMLGVDPIAWNNPFNPIIGTLGNSNFASAYMGVATPLATAGALRGGWPTWQRALCALAAVAILAVALQSNAVQGPIAAAAGLAVVALGLVLNLPQPARQVGLSSLLATVVLALAAGASGAVWGVGPAAPAFSGIAYQARLWYWDAAVRMFSDQPLLGVGLSHYGEYWRTARPAASVPGLGDEGYSDSAHSVFLQMFAQGGLVLGLAYMAFVLVTAVVLIRGLLRLNGSERILLAGFGGAWAAFQVQSFVSIDQVPLIVLHFALAGAVVVISDGLTRRTWRIGAPAARTGQTTNKRARRHAEPYTPPREATTADVVTIGTLGVAALLLAVLALAPLRANIAVRTGDLHLARGAGNNALASYRKASDLMPGLAFYWIKQGELLRRVEQPGPALRAFERAIEQDPYSVAAFSAGAQTAESLGQVETSRRFHDRAVELDPWAVDQLAAAARFELRHGGAAQARALLEEAVIRFPKEPELWAPLGDARAVLGNAEQAREAYATALQLDPQHDEALEGLRKLDGGPGNRTDGIALEDS
jgi:putative inorganic carbon (HCO3(-)) transporter